MSLENVLRHFVSSSQSRDSPLIAVDRKEGPSVAKKSTAIPSMSKELAKALKLVIALEGVFTQDEIQSIIDAPAEVRQKLAKEWRSTQALVSLAPKIIVMPYEPKDHELERLIYEVFKRRPASPDYEQLSNLLGEPGKLQVLANHLTPRQETMLVLRCGLHGSIPMTYKEIAEYFGIGSTRVGQIVHRAGAKLHSEVYKYWREQDRLANPHRTSADIDMLNCPIEDLRLSERPRHYLRKSGIDTVGELVDKTQDDLLAITFFGHKSLNEVEIVLDQHGLCLNQNV